MFATRFKPADAVICAILISVSLALMLIPAAAGRRDGTGRVIVTYVYVDNNAPADAYSLERDASIDLKGRNGISLTMEISGGGVRVSESDCPGHDCVKSGIISKPGQCIVCIPAGIVITVEGSGKKGDLHDATAG